MNAKLITLFTALVFATSLLIGFLPIDRDGVSCGSAFRPISYEADCEAARSTVRIVDIPLIFFGFTAFIGTAFITSRREEEK